MKIDGMFVRRAEHTNRGLEILLLDHLNGFDQDFNNEILQDLDLEAQEQGQRYLVHYNQVLDARVHQRYPNLDFRFNLANCEEVFFKQFDDYDSNNAHKQFDHFLCCFMAAEHVSRQFLSAILHRQGLWNDQTCTKNFVYSWETLDGNLGLYLDQDQHRVMHRFFVDAHSDINQRIINRSYQHCANVSNLRYLEPVYHDCWINIVANEMGTSYHPYVSEKFISAVAAQSLWLAYGQPGFHQHIETHYGFRLYRRLFDYAFDSIQNPVLRLIALVDSISRFRHLSRLDWHDLYLLESPTVAYNYHHLRSKAYLDHAGAYVG
jgi:hypothetical protein